MRDAEIEEISDAPLIGLQKESKTFTNCSSKDDGKGA